MNIDELYFADIFLLLTLIFYFVVKFN